MQLAFDLGAKGTFIVLIRCLTFTLMSAALSGAALASTVVVGKPDWPSAQVTAHIIADVLNDRLDVDAKLRPIGTVQLIGAIDRGEVDIHPEVWLPNSAAIVDEYVNQKKSLRLSAIGVKASQHICTTRETAEATGLKAVADLKKPEMAANFDTDADGKGEVWIGANTWASTRIERVRARSYGYDDTMMLLTMPEDQAFASVDAAVAVGSPIVFYCYEPHYLFALHDIVTLEEPAYDPAAWTISAPEQDVAWLDNSSAPTAWEPSHYHIGYATALADDNPAVVAFLEKMEITPQDAEAMSYAVHVEGRSPEEIAAKWIKDNSARIEEWIK
ncbi:glycine betaine ABC transporter substrate-binding protein [Acuticoccus sp. MNP-M23]|uniref:ABC transporter substrate-binding protein n=1 Tax=Acuticoccus sp. MNP-M23 TaxID=3072793 RepID=UPI0028164EA5|nr:glycine betaine ABC transporter substrate-binding protein [Acuticoccus sp. MNP-M23]WMS41230.1 glycine betaine ABC transporter substrate-binding protein [Acuticoccus sp. MNP-M23]